MHPTGWENSSHRCLLWERRNEWGQGNTWKHFQVSATWSHNQESWSLSSYTSKAETLIFVLCSLTLWGNCEVGRLLAVCRGNSAWRWCSLCRVLLILTLRWTAVSSQGREHGLLWTSAWLGVFTLSTAGLRSRCHRVGIREGTAVQSVPSQPQLGRLRVLSMLGWHSLSQWSHPSDFHSLCILRE